MKIYYSMILLTPKQMIDKLEQNYIICLSNDFYIDNVLKKVREELNIDTLSKPITKDRTLWFISKNEIDQKLLKS